MLPCRTLQRQELSLDLGTGGRVVNDKVDRSARDARWRRARPWVDVQQAAPGNLVEHEAEAAGLCRELFPTQPIGRAGQADIAF